MKKIFLLFLLITPFLLSAQDRGDQAYITHPGSMYTTYKFEPADEDKIVGIVGSEEFDRIDANCRETNWPAGMSNLTAFFDNEALIKEYTTYFVCRFADNKVLLRVPEGENRLMPSHMRPDRTIYFIVGEDGVSFTKPASSVAPSGGVTVTNFGDLYSTYTFSGSDEDDIIDAVGSSKFKEIKIYAHEDNWPSAISGFDERQTNRPKMYNYYVELTCRFGDKVVVKAPMSKNDHMTGGFKLDHDIYFIIAASSVDTDGGSSPGSSIDMASPTKKTTLSKGSAIEVTNFGDLYSTYSFEPNDSKDIIAATDRLTYTDITKYGNEENWPSAISGFDSRQTNRPKMYNYNVEYVCGFGDKCVIKAPMSKNNHMTGGFKLSHDIYFIINASSIAAK